MEAKTPNEKKKMARFMMTTDVRDVVEQWAKYREQEEHKDEPAVLCLAPMKCETYFSKASNPETQERFFEAFIRQYTEIVNTAKEHCPRCEVFYTPVESIGCVRLEKMDWCLAAGEQVSDQPPAISYKVLEPYHQVIAGVEGLTSAIYRYGADRIGAWFQAHHQNVDKAHNAVANAHNAKQQEYEARGFFTKFVDFWTDGDEKKQAEITKLDRQKKLKAEELDRLSKELKLLSDVLTKLADRSDQSPYFRKL
jgi:hypothetical protein